MTKQQSDTYEVYIVDLAHAAELYLSYTSLRIHLRNIQTGITWRAGQEIPHALVDCLFDVTDHLLCDLWCDIEKREVLNCTPQINWQAYDTDRWRTAK